ncbi:MAG: pseudouridine synthase [Eubacterium ramulus]
MRIKQPEIIYEDEAIIVCRKEAGVAVQTARAGQADVVSLLKNYRAKKKEEPYIGLIHRLDQPVEGVMVFAKTPQATAKLSAQVSSRSMEKEYLAVTTGVPEPQKGELRDWLLRDGKTNTSAVVARGTSQAKEAVLDYEVDGFSRTRSRHWFISGFTPGGITRFVCSLHMRDIRWWVTQSMESQSRAVGIVRWRCVPAGSDFYIL